jgi:hypothetical protein
MNTPELVAIKGRPGFMDIPEQLDRPGLKFDYGIMVCPPDLTVEETEDPNIVTVSFKATKTKQKELQTIDIIDPAECYIDTHINPASLKEIVDWTAAITISYFLFTSEQLSAIHKALEKKFRGYHDEENDL